MADYAAPVIEFEAEGSANTYKLNLEELMKIVGNEAIANKKVALVAVAGECRMGKSFILNFFVTYLEWLEKGGTGKWFDATTSLDKFKWKGGTNRDTSGVYIWSHPYILKDASHEEIVVLLMDTQGFFDHHSTVKDCATIFAMSTLLSSLQIFNIRSKINEDDLNNLLLFTEYANLACQHNEEAPAPLQRLLFLIRDWNYSYEHSYGYEGGQNYLDGVLKITAVQKPELQNLRKKLKTSFESINAFLLPYPGNRIASSLTEKVLGEIERQFGEQLETFVPSLFGRGDFPLEAKTINGSEISAGELLELFKSYMTIFNSVDLPSPKTILAATIEAVNMAAENKAMKKYDTLISQKMAEHRSLADLDILKKGQLQAERKALEVFAARPKLGDNDAAQSNLKNLKNHMQNRYNELKRIVEENIAIIEKKRKMEEERKRIEAEQEGERKRIAEEKELIRKQNEELEKKKTAELEEQNRRAKAAYDDAGVAYNPGDVSTIGMKLKEAHRLRKQKLSSIFTSIRKSRSVQLCFVMDATGSMQSHIDAVKKSIEDIVKQLTNTDRRVNFIGSTPNAQQMHVAFVAYRDHHDRRNLEVLDFTESVSDFKGFVSNMVAEGGGDPPEDVFGGINAAS